MKRLILLLCLFSTTYNYSQNFDTICINTILKTKTGNIYGVLSDPCYMNYKNSKDDTINIKNIKNKGKYVVLMIAGSGPTNRDGNNKYMKSNMLKYLAEDLYNKGIAVLRYDKRGIENSKNIAEKSEEQLTLQTYIDDAIEWVKYLKKRYKNIILMGHSEGSLIGISASLKSNKVSAFVSISGSGRSYDIVIKEQLAYLPEQYKKRVYNMIDSLKLGYNIKKENIPQIFMSLLRPSIQPYLISAMAHEPSNEIAKLKIPVLIMQGDKDIQVSVKDAEILHNALPSSKLFIINNMNHVLKYSETTDKNKQMKSYYYPDERILQEVSTIIADFIKANF